MNTYARARDERLAGVVEAVGQNLKSFSTTGAQREAPEEVNPWSAEFIEPGPRVRLPAPAPRIPTTRGGWEQKGRKRQRWGLRVLYAFRLVTTTASQAVGL
jgi:hypothetical protein